MSLKKFLLFRRPYETLNLFHLFPFFLFPGFVQTMQYSPNPNLTWSLFKLCQTGTVWPIGQERIKIIVRSSLIAAPCPPGWLLNSTSCYKLQTFIGDTTLARLRCQTDLPGSDLVSIKSLEEQALVEGQLVKKTGGSGTKFPAPVQEIMGSNLGWEMFLCLGCVLPIHG